MVFRYISDCRHQILKCRKWNSWQCSIWIIYLVFPGSQQKSLEPARTLASREIKIWDESDHQNVKVSTLEASDGLSPCLKSRLVKNRTQRNWFRIKGPGVREVLRCLRRSRHQSGQSDPPDRGFPKMVVPNNHGVFLLKMIILGCFGGTTI